MTLVIFMRIKVIVSGSNLSIPVSSPDSITVSGTFDMLTFSNYICTETHFVPGVKKEYIKFITFEGKDVTLLKQTDTSIIFEGEVKKFSFKTDKGFAFQSYVVLPCDITISQLEEF